MGWWLLLNFLMLLQFDALPLLEAAAIAAAAELFALCQALTAAAAGVRPGSSLVVVVACCCFQAFSLGGVFFSFFVDPVIASPVFLSTGMVGTTTAWALRRRYFSCSTETSF